MDPAEQAFLALAKALGDYAYREASVGPTGHADLDQATQDFLDALGDRTASNHAQEIPAGIQRIYDAVAADRALFGLTGPEFSAGFAAAKHSRPVLILAARAVASGVVDQELAETSAAYQDAVNEQQAAAIELQGLIRAGRYEQLADARGRAEYSGPLAIEAAQRRHAEVNVRATQLELKLPQHWLADTTSDLAVAEENVARIEAELQDAQAAVKVAQRMHEFAGDVHAVIAREATEAQAFVALLERQAEVRIRRMAGQLPAPPPPLAERSHPTAGAPVAPAAGSQTATATAGAQSHPLAEHILMQAAPGHEPADPEFPQPSQWARNRAASANTLRSAV